MEDSEMQPLAAALERRIAATSCELHRSLYSQIDWNDRLVCIKGAKGTARARFSSATALDLSASEMLVERASAVRFAPIGG